MENDSHHFRVCREAMNKQMPGLRPAKGQEERAVKHAGYVREAAAASWCVGAHWFQYLDQPLTGRTDGEN